MIAALAFGASATGQTIDQNSWQPGPGVTLVEQGTGLQVNVGPAGADQTWDLSGISTGSTLDRLMKAPASIGGGSSFPTATFAINELFGHAFYKLSNDGLSYLGHHDPPVTQVYQDPKKLIAFPCSFNSTWTDDYLATWDQGGINWTRTGSLTGLADGYGTLILPEGTYTNVLRVKLTDEQVDAPNGAASERTTYYFLKPGIPWLLGTFTTFTEELLPGVPNGPVQIGYESDWLTDIATGLSDLDRLGLGLDVHPNPARDRAVVTFSTGGGNLDLAVLDAPGNMVLQEQITGQPMGIGTQELDLSHLPAGLYFVRIIDVHGQQGVKRLVVE